MSNIQRHNILPTVTILIAVIIAVAILLQLHVVLLILSVPLFLIPVSIYTTVIGLKSKQERNVAQNYSYYFTLSAVMLAIGIAWLVLYENMGVIMTIIAVLVIALGYVYLNKIKSIKIHA